MERIEKILVPTDFSEDAERGMDYAVFLSRQLQATLLLVHVMRERACTDEEARFEIEQIGERLDRASFARFESGVAIETHILKGTPAVEIARAAQNLECGLIVMGTRHGEGSFTEGGVRVSESVYRLSHVPVLLIKPSKDVMRVDEGGIEEREAVLAGG